MAVSYAPDRQARCPRGIGRRCAGVAIARARRRLAGGRVQDDDREPRAVQGLAGGAYSVTDDGHFIVRGKYTDSGSKITFGHETAQGACAKTGTYTWTKSGKTLRFKRMSDAASCSGRITILSDALTQSH
jgi:hypothetical protein